MNNKPLISVITPAYNHEKYIEETINSIINQTYQNLEYIIIDDGSTDNTWQIIQRLKPLCEKRFAHFVCLTQKNSGTTLTLNRLIDKTQGEYLYCISSDDVAKPQAIEKLYQHISADPQNVLVVSDDELIDSASQPISWDAKKNILPYGKGYNSFGSYLKKMRPDVDFNGKNFGSYETLLSGNYIPNGFIIRKSAMPAYTTNAPLEDWYQNLQLSKKGKLLYLDEILFSYRWHSSNTIANTSKINEYSKRTFEYEKEILQQNPQYKEFLDMYTRFSENGNKKVSFKIGSFLEIYRCKSPFFNKKFLRLFNKTWLLSCKNK